MLRRIVTAAYKPLLKRYLGKSRRYSYKNISLIVEPGVFHPAFFFSTKLLLEYMEKIEVTDRSLLELGAGSGCVAIRAATRGARVTATDISKIAIRTTEQNATLNNVRVTVLHSDLFDDIPRQHFDLLVVNPPYYKKDPLEEPDHAWYCGEHGEFFQRFFSLLNGYTDPNSTIVMVLSDECDIDMVRAYARGNGFVMHAVVEKKKYWETVSVFEIRTSAEETHHEA